MPTRITGKPAIYAGTTIGVEAQQPPNITFHKRNPTTTDYFEFNTGDIWVNSQPNNTNPVTGTFKVWMLVAKNIHIATWIPFVNGVTGDLVSLTGNTGGTVFGDVNQNINVVGDGVGITIAGNPATHTLTASLVGGGQAIQVLQASDGTQAVPVAGVIIFPDQVVAAGFGGAVTIDSNIFSNVNPNLGQNFTNNLKPTIKLPTTSTSSGNFNAGCVFIGGTTAANSFMHSLGSQNTFLGQGAGNVAMTTGSAIHNTGIGFGSCSVITTGTMNCGCGNGALLNVTTGSNNASFGSNALQNVTTGSNNTACGFQVFTNAAAGAITTGSNNIGIGAASGQNYSNSETNNILINNFGVNAESNVIRIGATATSTNMGTGATITANTTCFIAGVRGVTTANNNAVAVLVDSAGQFGTISSSIKAKDNVKDMGSYSSRLFKLRPITFNFKKHSPDIISVGLIAEEVAEVFPELAVYNQGEVESVKYQDLVPMLLNELQKLNKRIELLESICAGNL